MELAGACICRRDGECGCRSAIVQFLNILHTVDQRVSTTKLASGNLKNEVPNGRACIDKLTLELDQPVPVERLRITAQQGDFKLERTRLRDGKWYLALLGGELGFFAQIIRAPSEELIWKLVTRPSAFETFADYKQALAMILETEEVAAARIQRLDLAIDYDADLPTILKSLDIPNKRSRVVFMDEGSTRTGIMVGKGTEKIIAYDKAKRERIGGPLTRIELQLKGQKLPTRRFELLDSAIADWLPHSFFTKISMHGIRLNENMGQISQRHGDRINELKVMLQKDGFYASRCSLNQNRNFKRDYLPLLQTTPWTTQPIEIIKRDLEVFFNKN